ncbi:hypothetical protein GGI25_004562 [Coemansia spiralis]|uniref:Uncharacterized protein n=2 Tax=Coemansia TaxID=4863 RepID=A0A9W8G4W5_9FUNG|nr:hypothetical protein EDC05_004368 [Coemansia umbellata]KAJ2673815.1 hypothetical protein GGI25_004562 [Coemansia spiralis]
MDTAYLQEGWVVISGPAKRRLAPSREARGRRLSQASLTDFLRCTPPYRPSFLNRSTRAQADATQTEPPSSEFLHRALNDFAAFHAVDFTPIPVDGGTTLWSVFASIFDNYSRDITFY